MIYVLYVDDEPALLDITQLYLQRLGDFKVDIADSALLALEKLKIYQYNAIISDYQMPQMNGIEFLKEVRCSGNNVPFIIFTGRGSEEIADEAFKSGANYYLQKSVNVKEKLTELVYQIQKIVQKQEKEGRLTISDCYSSVAI